MNSIVVYQKLASGEATKNYIGKIHDEDDDVDDDDDEDEDVDDHDDDEDDDDVDDVDDEDDDVDDVDDDDVNDVDDEDDDEEEDIYTKNLTTPTEGWGTIRKSLPKPLDLPPSQVLMRLIRFLFEKAEQTHFPEVPPRSPCFQATPRINSTPEE